MITPEIPQLDPMRVQVRKHALMHEISTKPRRKWWRVAVPATVLAAAAVTATVVWPVSTPSAYASWTAEPRAPGTDVDSVIAVCRKQLAEFDAMVREQMSGWPATPTEVTIVDQRGNLTLVLFTGPQSQRTCLNTPGGLGSGGGGGDVKGLPSLGSRRFLLMSVQSQSEPQNGAPARILTAMVSPDVGKMRVDTADGKQVTGTLGNGWGVAWWPDVADATLITLYDHAGNVLETERPRFK